MDDDLVKANFSKVLLNGYVDVIVTAAFILWSLKALLAGRDVLRIIIAVGEAKPLYAFAIMEARSAWSPGVIQYAPIF